MELAIIKGLIIALALVGSFFIYETIQAKTPSGQNIECNWDCSNANWSECTEGYVFRNTSLCTVDNEKCLVSEPRPSDKKLCEN